MMANPLARGSLLLVATALAVPAALAQTAAGPRLPRRRSVPTRLRRRRADGDPLDVVGPGMSISR